MSKTQYVYHPYALSDIASLETIEVLHTHSILLDQATPDTLKRLKQLRFLHFYNTPFAHPLSAVFLQFKQLEGLFLHQVDGSAISSRLDGLKQLTTLSLYAEELSALPSALIHLPQLENLELHFSRLAPYFDDWHLLEHLPRLQRLQLSKMTYEQFPTESILALEQLQELYLSKNNLQQLSKTHPNFVEGIAYCYGHSSLEKKYYKKLSAKMQLEQLPWTDKAIWLNLLGQHYTKLDRLATKQQILAATDVQPATFSAIRLHALEYYQQRWGEAQSLAPGQKITVLGSITTSKNTLRTQLKALDIQYSSQLTDDCTHVLLGQRSKGAYLPALEQGLVIVTEKQVLDYINTHTTQYLVDEQETYPEQLDHLKALLTSGQDENAALAMSFFEQGGFPPTLLTALFYSYMEVKQSALREKIRRLLRQYGSTGLSDLLKSRWVIFQPYTSENAIRTKLKKLERTTQLNLIELAQYGYQHHKQGMAYLLEQLPPNEAQSILADHTDAAGTLNLQRLGLASMPSSVYAAQQVRCIDISQNSSIRTIPVKKLAKMPMLERIVARFCYYLSSNEPWQQELQAMLPHVQLTF